MGCSFDAIFTTSIIITGKSVASLSIHFLYPINSQSSLVFIIRNPLKTTDIVTHPTGPKGLKNFIIFKIELHNANLRIKINQGKAFYYLLTNSLIG